LERKIGVMDIAAFQEEAIAQNHRGMAQFRAGNLSAAIAHFQQAIVHDPQLHSAHYNLGLAYFDQGHYAAAIAPFAQACTLHPNFPTARTYHNRAIYYAAVAQRGYTFSQDWFGHNIPRLRSWLGAWRDRPHLRGLEIGSWEGRSACWFLDEILTHPTAHLTCIDTFGGGSEHQTLNPQELRQIEARFDYNLRRSGAAHKVQKWVGTSPTVLVQLQTDPTRQPYDFIYIDGSHLAADVLQDAVLAWPLLRVGGLMIFDDYGLNLYADANLNPAVGIEAFLSGFGAELVVRDRTWQVVVEKRSSPTDPPLSVYAQQILAQHS
jgi:tetratricopeptide (TPR) repeat protein